MDIEKTYELMNELQIFKNLLKRIDNLEVELDNKTFKFYIRIYVNIMEEMIINGGHTKKKEICENIKNCLKPSLELKIKELEKEIKNGK